MKLLGLLIALFASLVFVMPPSNAQDAKKDADKSEKKDEKKDPDKKDEDKKKPETPPVKEKKLTEKMPAHGAVFRSKILSANGASNREFTVEIQEIDPKKVYDVNQWKATRSQQLAQQYAQALNNKDFKARANAIATWNRDSAIFQVDLAKKNVYSAKPMEVRAHDDAKVRTSFLPVMFDDEGRQKKWTEKERKEFRGDTMIPGYPSDFDALKSGQFVEIYMTKKPAPAKDAPKKKKTDDDLPALSTPEFIVIVVLADGK